MSLAKSNKSIDDRMAMFIAYHEQPTEALRNQLVEAYLHIAKIIAARFSGKGVDFDDLYQVASLSLIKAVERFDPDYGVKFQTYATTRMVGEVKNYFRDKLHTMSMPRKGNQLVKQIETARAELSQELMRSPTLNELIERSGLPESDVVDALIMKGAMYPASLDSEPPEGESPLLTFLGREDLNFDQFELKETIRKLLFELDETERRVLTERYFNEHSQREVGELMQVSQMTISRVERRALERIRTMLAEKEY